MKRWLSLIALAMAVGGVWAQQGQPGGQGTKEEPKKRRVEIQADRLTYDDKSGLTTLEGNVVVRQEDITLTAPKVFYDANDKKAWCDGDWKIVDRHRETIKTGEGEGTSEQAQPEELDVETTVTGQKVTVDMNAKVAIVEGEVTVVRLPSPAPGAETAAPAPAESGGAATAAPSSGTDAAAVEQETPEDKREEVKSARRKKATITCDRLEYFYDEKRAVGSGAVTVVQEKRTARADAVEFKEKEDLVTVTGGVVITDDKGQRLECEKAVINTAEDTVEAWDVKMVGFVEEEEKKPEEAAAPSGTPAETPAELAPSEPAPSEADGASQPGGSPPPGQ